MFHGKALRRSLTLITALAFAIACAVSVFRHESEVPRRNKLVSHIKGNLLVFEDLLEGGLPKNVGSHSWRSALAKQGFGFFNINLDRPWGETEPATPPSLFCVDGNEAAVFMIRENRNPESEKLRLSDAAPSLAVLVGFENSGVHWMEVSDVSLDALRLGKLSIRTPEKTTDLAPRELLLGFVDGSVWRLNADVPLRWVAEVCDPLKADASRRERLIPFRQPTWEEYWLGR